MARAGSPVRQPLVAVVGDSWNHRHRLAAHRGVAAWRVVAAGPDVPENRARGLALSSGYGFVTLSRMKSLALVPIGTLKVCCGNVPVSETAVQLPDRSVWLHSAP